MGIDWATAVSSGLGEYAQEKKQERQFSQGLVQQRALKLIELAEQQRMLMEGNVKAGTTIMNTAIDSGFRTRKHIRGFMALSAEQRKKKLEQLEKARMQFRAGRTDPNATFDVYDAFALEKPEEGSEEYNIGQEWREQTAREFAGMMAPEGSSLAEEKTFMQEVLNLMAPKDALSIASEALGQSPEYTNKLLYPSLRDTFKSDPISFEQPEDKAAQAAHRILMATSERELDQNKPLREIEGFSTLVNDMGTDDKADDLVWTGVLLGWVPADTPYYRIDKRLAQIKEASVIHKNFTDNIGTLATKPGDYRAFDAVWVRTMAGLYDADGKEEAAGGFVFKDSGSYKTLTTQRAAAALSITHNKLRNTGMKEGDVKGLLNRELQVPIFLSAGLTASFAEWKLKKENKGKDFATYIAGLQADIGNLKLGGDKEASGALQTVVRQWLNGSENPYLPTATFNSNNILTTDISELSTQNVLAAFNQKYKLTNVSSSVNYGVANSISATASQIQNLIGGIGGANLSLAPPTATGTPTATATGTGTPTATATGTGTPTATGTGTPTATGTGTPTATATTPPPPKNDLAPRLAAASVDIRQKWTDYKQDPANIGTDPDQWNSAFNKIVKAVLDKHKLPDPRQLTQEMEDELNLKEIDRRLVTALSDRPEDRMSRQMGEVLGDRPEGRARRRLFPIPSERPLEGETRFARIGERLRIVADDKRMRMDEINQLRKILSPSLLKRTTVEEDVLSDERRNMLDKLTRKFNWNKATMLTEKTTDGRTIQTGRNELALLLDSPMQYLDEKIEEEASATGAKPATPPAATQQAAVGKISIDDFLDSNIQANAQLQKPMAEVLKSLGADKKAKATLADMYRKLIEDANLPGTVPRSRVFLAWLNEKNLKEYEGKTVRSRDVIADFWKDNKYIK